MENENINVAENTVETPVSPEAESQTEVVTEETVVAEETVAEEVIAEEVVAEEVVAEEVVTEETVTEETVAEEVIAEEVVTEETVAEEVVAEETVVEETVVEEAVTEEVVTEETAAAPAPKKNRKLMIGLIVAGCILALLAAFIGLGIHTVYSDLNAANELYAQGEYMKAKEIYQEYSFIGWASEMPQDCDYQDAIATHNSGDYMAAHDKFVALGDYMDSADRADAALYEHANELYDNGKYQEAIDVYTELGAYEDSLDKIDSATYTIADQRFQEGDYDTAAKLFGDLNEYKDAPTRVMECMVEKGIKLYEAGDYENAEVLLDAYAGQSEKAKVYSYLCYFYQNRDGSSVMGLDALLYDMFLEYKDSYPEVAEVMDDPFFHFVRFWGAGWKYSSYTIDGNSKKNTIYYYVPWKTPKGSPAYKVENDTLRIYNGDKLWFTITGFDSYEKKHPGKMYVTGANGKKYTFKRYKVFE